MRPDPASELAEIRALAVDNKIELALSRCRRLIRAEPRLAEAHALLAACLLQLHQPEEAVAAADAAIDLAPDDAQALHVKARALAALGHETAAMTTIERVIDLEPMVPLYRATQMRIAWKQHDTETARSSAQAVLQLDPEHAAALRLLDATKPPKRVSWWKRLAGAGKGSG